MTVIPFRRRVEAAFDAETAERFGPEYLAMLMENWRDTAKAMRRANVSLVLLIVTFLLMSGAKTAGFNLGPVRLTNVASVLTLIPVLTSFLLCEVILLSGAYQAYGVAVQEVVKATQLTVYENDLHYLLTPAELNPSGYDGPSWMKVWERPGDASAKAVGITSDLLEYALVVGSVGFFIYAYIDLYSNRHINSIIVSLSLVVTLFFFVRAVAVSFAFSPFPEMGSDEPDESEEGQPAEPTEDVSP